MSLTFGTSGQGDYFTVRGVSFPQRNGIETPTQTTTMYGGVGMSVLRGAQQAGKLSFDVWQDGFSTLALAVAFADTVMKSSGKVDTLKVTGRPDVMAGLNHVSEAKAVKGGGTTTGFHVRLNLDFEEIAQ